MTHDKRHTILRGEKGGKEEDNLWEKVSKISSVSKYASNKMKKHTTE